jgi:CRP-like cAMP-binding protein
MAISKDSRTLLPGTHGTKIYPAGQPIFSAHDPGDRMFIVQEGEAEIRLGTTVVETVSAGGILGEMSLIDDAPRSADAIAVSDCMLVPVDQRAFAALIGESPEFALDVMRILVRRLREMNERL